MAALGSVEFRSRGNRFVDDVSRQSYSEPLERMGDLACNFSCLSVAVLKTKKEIAKDIAKELGISQTLAKDAVQMTLDAIVDGLVADGRIELRKFGVFEVKDRAEKRVRNPQTGDLILVPAKKVVSFRPGTEMEERVKRLSAKTLSEAREEGLERERQVRDSNQQDNS